MRVMVRNDNYPDYNKALLETLNQQYGYAKDVKKYFDLKQIDERDSVRQLYYVLENKKKTPEKLISGVFEYILAKMRYFSNAYSCQFDVNPFSLQLRHFRQ